MRKMAQGSQDTQHNDTQYKGLICDTQHDETQHEELISDTQNK